MNLRRLAALLIVSMLADPVSADVQLVRLAPDNRSDFAPHGKEVDWIYNDILMRNEQIMAVVASSTPERKANMTVQQVGGCLIDLTRRDDPNDQLSAYYPGARSFTFSQPTVTTDGTRWQPLAESLVEPLAAQQIGLRFKGVPMEDAEGFQSLELTVTYWLRNDADAIEIESEYKNVTVKDTELRLLDSVRVDRDFELNVNTAINLFTANEYWWNQAYGVLPDGFRVDCSTESLEKKRPLLSFARGEQLSFVLPPGETMRLVRMVLPAASQLELLGRALRAGGRDGAGPGQGRGSRWPGEGSQGCSDHAVERR